MTRIRSALRLGSTSLSKILEATSTTELKVLLENFFINSIERHRSTPVSYSTNMSQQSYLEYPPQNQMHMYNPRTRGLGTFFPNQPSIRVYELTDENDFPSLDPTSIEQTNIQPRSASQSAASEKNVWGRNN